MKQVKCISPHGGCHNGMDRHGHPVHPIPIVDENKQVTGSRLPDVDPAALRLPPNPGGYIMDVRIPGRHCAVGQVYDVPDDFQADGFHWEDVEPPHQDEAPAPPAAAEGE